jgi:hypothetical protein
MPDFFIPFAESKEEAERVYRVFLKNHLYPVQPKAGRLFHVVFIYRKHRLIAEIGQEINGWPEPAGPVLGIIESPELVTIHTQLRGGLSATPILVSPSEVSGRVYFTDFPDRY